ncbi:hypothetical protein EKO27_g11097 [Xylaria grammica]|uniref:Uncharacterized protein n=1 Tax=Xylaria grammica TaxID=363999 RepID=A0A439CPC4_9PEZI|nr:hypothetical protein EKO27_g11097 [Xylaria grammica]
MLAINQPTIVIQELEHDKQGLWLNTTFKSTATRPGQDGRETSERRRNSRESIKWHSETILSSPIASLEHPDAHCYCPSTIPAKAFHPVIRNPKSFLGTALDHWQPTEPSLTFDYLARTDQSFRHFTEVLQSWGAISRREACGEGSKQQEWESTTPTEPTDLR